MQLVVLTPCTVMYFVMQSKTLSTAIIVPGQVDGGLASGELESKPKAGPSTDAAQTLEGKPKQPSQGNPTGDKKNGVAATDEEIKQLRDAEKVNRFEMGRLQRQMSKTEPITEDKVDLEGSNDPKIQESISPISPEGQIIASSSPKPKQLDDKNMAVSQFILSPQSKGELPELEKQIEPVVKDEPNSPGLPEPGFTRHVSKVLRRRDTMFLGTTQHFLIKSSLKQGDFYDVGPSYQDRRNLCPAHSQEQEWSQEQESRRKRHTRRSHHVGNDHDYLY